MRQNRPLLLRLCWARALPSPVTFLTGDHVMQIGFGQISPSASSTRDLGTRLSETITELERTRTNQYQDFLVPVFDFVRSVGRSVTADQKCVVWSPIWTIASCEATKVWNDFENLFLTAGKTWHSRDYKTAQLLNNRNASQLVCYTDRRVFYILRQISLWLLSLSHRQYRKLPHMSILHFFALSLSSRVVIVFRKLRSKCSLSTRKRVSVNPRLNLRFQ